MGSVNLYNHSSTDDVRYIDCQYLILTEDKDITINDKNLYSGLEPINDIDQNDIRYLRGSPIWSSYWWEEVESNHRSRIFSPAHRPRMSSSHKQGANEIIIGIEPITFCLADKCSTK